MFFGDYFENLYFLAVETLSGDEAHLSRRANPHVSLEIQPACRSKASQAQGPVVEIVFQS